MVLCKTKKGGSSLGIIIPNDVVREMKIAEDQDIDIEISKKSRRVLRELWDFGSGRPRLSRQRFDKIRKEIESHDAMP